ncbi:MAG TPA: FAD-binding oxidoreductase, partial [Gemmatimonadaceae bacterium]|nr:FAD-binding oxidoreductase [Gemmatimonadaceae bacterium]
MRPPGFRGAWREDETARAVYAESAGITRAWPVAVARPDDEADVTELLRWATRQGVMIVPRGAGSSMSGGATGPGIVVDLSGLHHVAAADPAWRTVHCGPGATLARVNRAANAAGLRFPVDPSSGAFCTVGGMAATNAAGARSLRFGSMRPWVAGLDCVFADGTRALLRRGAAAPTANATLVRLAEAAPELRRRAAALPRPAVRKNSSGYAVHEFAESGDPIDVLVGSEGTLALFVGLELRLAGLPEAEATLLITWDDLERCMRGAALAREAGAAACELLDRTFLDFAIAGSGGPVPAESEAVLLIALEQGEADASGALSDQIVRARAAAAITARADALRRTMLAAGATQAIVATEPEAAVALWSVRHAASPTLARLDPALKSLQIVEDGCVPVEHLAAYVQGLRNALARHRIRGVLFGHAGDAHVHGNALVDVREPDWRVRIEHLFLDVVELTASFGGTLAGEHGDGRLRTPVLDRIWPPSARELFAEIKHLFDPGGILNAGV